MVGMMRRTRLRRRARRSRARRSRALRSTRSRQRGGNSTSPGYNVRWYNSLPPEYIPIINESLNSEFVGVEPAEMAHTNRCGVLATTPDGTLAAYTIIDKNRGRCWYIQWLTTLPAHRGRGLARQMIEVLKEQNSICLMLHVAPDSIASKIYAAAGFIKTGQIKPMTDDQGVSIQMEEMIRNQ